MPKRAPSVKSSDRHAVVRAAIEYADKHAGEDDGKFVEALISRFPKSVEKQRSGRAIIPIRAAEAPTKSFHIYEDPRYLANARALARRTLGGLRVLGGAPVKVGEFLDCVAVGSDNQWGCTGTLIAPNVVLTAGHCADFATRVFIGVDVTKPGKVVRVSKRIRHPQYHKGKHNDLLVLLLAEKITTVLPRKLAAKNDLDKATDGRIVGFGTTDPTGNFGYGVKRFADVPIVSPSCNGTVDGQDDKVAYGCDVGFELVAGRPLLERDSCKGDSGGPFYVAGKHGEWLLGGATSRATDSAMHECGDGGVYVRVDRYRTWIDKLPGISLA